MNIVAIVEGHGEVGAVPELLRRLNAWIAPSKYVHVAAPIRTNRSRFLNDEEEFSKLLQLASHKATAEGWILVLLDADDDCPVELCANLESRATQCLPHRKISVVIANREYEAWYIAAAESLAGYRGFQPLPNLTLPDPDQPRNAKGWLSQQMPNGYHEVTDQPAFASVMSLELAWIGSRSFRRLCAEYCRQCANLIP